MYSTIIIAEIVKAPVELATLAVVIVILVVYR